MRIRTFVCLIYTVNIIYKSKWWCSCSITLNHICFLLEPHLHLDCLLMLYKPICSQHPGSGKSSNDLFWFHGNPTPGRVSAGCSHCLRRFYHARAVTKQEFHYLVFDEWLFGFHCSCPRSWGQLYCKPFPDIFLWSCRTILWFL